MSDKEQSDEQEFKKIKKNVENRVVPYDEFYMDRHPEKALFLRHYCKECNQKNIDDINFLRLLIKEGM